MTDLNEKALEAARETFARTWAKHGDVDALSSAIRAYLEAATPPDVARLDDMLGRFERAAFASTANLPRGKEALALAQEIERRWNVDYDDTPAALKGLEARDA